MEHFGVGGSGWGWLEHLGDGWSIFGVGEAFRVGSGWVEDFGVWCDIVDF